MKRIALIHTVKGVADTFEKRLKEYLPMEIKVHNLLDDFLADDPNEVGEFTKTNRLRLFNDIRNAEMTGADLIVVTCSTLTPTVEKIRPFIGVPVIAIDDAMARLAARSGQKVLVMATAESTVQPTLDKIGQEARSQGLDIGLSSLVCKPAFVALKAMDMALHDKLLKEMAGDIQGFDAIVLAQASMAHLEDEIREITKVPVLSSPRLCFEEIRETLLK